MDFDLPGDDDQRRVAIRNWLADRPHPTMAEIAEAGYVVPHWPRPWGLEADPMHQLVIDEELARAGIAVRAGSASVGPRPRSCWPAPRSSRPVPSGHPEGRTSGASCSASRRRARTWPR